MTNRDYVMGLRDEELAELLNNNRVCDYVGTCPDCDCIKCITKWLETERKPNVEEGQIRETDSHKWLVGSISANRDICGMLSEKGVIRYFPIDVVITWKIVTDETEEMFYSKITNDLYNKASNNLKETNKDD